MPHLKSSPGHSFNIFLKRPMTTHLTIFSLVIAMILFLSVTSYAEIATSVESEQVCQNWLSSVVHQKGAWAGDTNPLISGRGEIRADDGILLARYYNIQPTGFVIVPVLKEMTPIKAYSDVSILDERQSGGFLQMLKEILTERMDLYRQRFGSLDSAQIDGIDPVFGKSQRLLWNTYDVSPKLFKSNIAQGITQLPEEAGPLLTSAWHQRTPYKNYCPQGDGGQTVVGCVATAAAQIMKFWEWPPSGYSSHSYLWGGDHSCGGSTPSEVLSADFSDAYDWEDMPDECDGGCPPADSAALAELCYEVGVAFDMDYGACGSGTYVSLATSVFPGYFKYSRDIKREDRIDYTLEGWYQIIKEEIDAGRPIQYRINSHSIVCDGYRNLGTQYEYHMNYGWGGSFTTWFVLDSLYCSWVPGDVCPASEEMMITHIQPQTTPLLDYVGMTVSEDSGDGDGHADPGETINISVDICNNGWNAYNVQGALSSDDPSLSMITPVASFGTSMPWGDEKSSQNAFQVQIDPACPDPHIATLILNLTSSGGFAFTDSFYVFIGDTPGFADDMESGAGLWKTGAYTFGFGNQWHQETYRETSGSYSWKIGGVADTQYANSLDGALITQPFLLPDNARLSFNQWIDAEQGEDPGTAWDGAIVMISSGDGHWTQIEPEGGYPYVIIDNPASPYEPGTPCFSGSSDWQSTEFDLSSYSGVAQIMFRFGSDGAATGEGWYVDDVQIASGGYNCGDANGDGGLNVSDAVYIINYVFTGGAAPDPICVGNANGDSNVNVSDAVYIINHVFIGGAAPVSDCCPL